MLAEARRDGLRLDAPEDRRAFMAQVVHRIAAKVATRQDPDGVEPWQHEAVDTLTITVVDLARGALAAPPPDCALLVTLVGDEGGTVAVDERVVVQATV
jgi:hypothetical protein